jgi:TadE-like protein
MRTASGAARTRGPLLSRTECGQATVESAIVMLFVMVLILLLAQAAMVVRDKVAVMNAARDAAREASVGATQSRIEELVSRTVPHARVHIERSGHVGAPVTVEVIEHESTSMPIIGPLIPDFNLSERLTMRSER